MVSIAELKAKKLEQQKRLEEEIRQKEALKEELLQDLRQTPIAPIMGDNAYDDNDYREISKAHRGRLCPYCRECTDFSVKQTIPVLGGVDRIIKCAKCGGECISEERVTTRPIVKKVKKYARVKNQIENN